ncbi:MAG: hypothetical protein R3C68_02235 [Myxococcota bacterium]
MSDPLTVHSGNQTDAATTRPSTAAAESGDTDQRAKLDSLRRLAKERVGRTLSDQELQNIVARHKAKQSHRAKIETSKAAFETGQAQESVTSRQAKQKAEAQRSTTGAQSARSIKDGLTGEQRRSVTSDPDANPLLPPPQAKPTTPEQAAKILGAMSEFLLDGEVPFDLAAYAKTLKQLPPTPIPAKGKAASAQANKPQAGDKTTNSAAKNANPQGSKLASQSAAMARAPARTPSNRAGHLPDVAPQGRPGDSPAHAAASTFSLKRQYGFSDLLGVTNLGGGLGSDASFDGLRFNWDAFFTLFIIRTEKDLQKWRRLIKDLRALEHQVELNALELGTKMLEFRQLLQRSSSLYAVKQSMLRASSLYKQGVARSKLGANPQAAADKDEAIRKHFDEEFNHLKARNQAVQKRIEELTSHTGKLDDDQRALPKAVLGERQIKTYETQRQKEPDKANAEILRLAQDKAAAQEKQIARLKDRIHYTEQERALVKKMFGEEFMRTYDELLHERHHVDSLVGGIAHMNNEIRRVRRGQYVGDQQKALAQLQKDGR